ncbi:dienelactone hydrolase family protein [Corynebacterium heidelbergense]|uniref:dienelactone hydrolase family protein n=1 Tax=Corynebacterium heidelbergense TaxID=2055947 RepID=UPI001EE72944|nr:alpha/beta hydrolase [Corynebacterium heidelbergense]WCZ37285.1 Alpha/beta hydrolase family protein [Corynebacterium heidelbergense]
MADNLKNLVARLGKRGPHRVLTGDLSFAGIPGKVYTPADGNGIAGIAFGHDWRLGVCNYHGTLRHLASWGIAVAAPDTERGFLPNARGFASDLETCLQILAGVKLGTGSVSVSPNKLFLAGHGFGASCAVLAATGRSAQSNPKSGYHNQPSIAGVMAVYPSDTTPSPYEAAKQVDAPGLVLHPGSAAESQYGDAKRMAALWRGEVVYRTIEGAGSSGFHEAYGRKFLLGGGTPEFAKQDLVRALMVGFTLAESEGKYDKFRETNVKLKNTETASQVELFRNLPEHMDTKQLLAQLQF